MKLLCFAAAALVLAGCATTPPPDPISIAEIASLASGGPESPALRSALENRPLGFALTYENLKELERRWAEENEIAAIVDGELSRLSP